MFKSKSSCVVSLRCRWVYEMVKQITGAGETEDFLYCSIQLAILTVHTHTHTHRHGAVLVPVTSVLGAARLTLCRLCQKKCGILAGGSGGCTGQL